MAATGYSPIQLYYSTTASTAPTAGNLASGELAINITDGKLYYKDNAGAVQLLSTSTTANGTANGVLYLNGSKVATAGSALTFDGTGALVVSTSATNGAISVVGPSSGSNSGAQFNIVNGATTTSIIGNYSRVIGGAYNESLAFYNNGNDFVWYSGSERMRITSTGLGIGTSSPGTKLDVRGTIQSVAASVGLSAINSSTFYYMNVSSTGLDTYTDANASAPMLFKTGGTERMRLDSSGNLGLGLTPSAGVKLQIGSGEVMGFMGPGGAWSTNAYYQSGFKYATTAAAAKYDQANGAHLWFTAPSGTAGNAITFTQAMTLDASGNLGVGTTSPGAKLDIQGTVAAGGSLGLRVLDTTNSLAAQLFRTGSTYSYAGVGGLETWLYSQGTSNLSLGPDGAGAVKIVTNGAERARIDSSGNLGIGTSSPTSKLHVNGGDGSNIRYQGTTDSVALGINGTTPFVGTITNGSFAIQTNATTRALFDTSGNLGLGVTPSAWGSNYKAFNVGNTGSLAGDNNFGLVELGNNYYNNNTNNIYKYNGNASTYKQYLGEHRWYNAASGTAGNAITFTQAMTLGASGNLAIGSTSASARIHSTVADGAYPIAVSGTTKGMRFETNSSESRIIGVDNTLNSSYQPLMLGGSVLILSSSGNTERARIDSSGNLLVGTTSQITGEKLGVDTTGASAKAITARNNAGSGAATVFVWNSATSGDNLFMGFGTEANGSQRGTITYNRTAGLTAYNTTSDYRAKDITGPVENSGALIDSVPVYMGKMKGATQERPMFIAHETPDYAHTGEKDAVDAEGNPVYQQMDASALIPVMWAEIQSLRARVAALES